MSYNSGKIKNFKELSIANKSYQGEKKILVCCTSKYLLKCANGKHFNTGHHPVEILLPMYHLDKCGFKFDIATADGAPVAIEEWGFPLAVGFEDKLKGMQTKVKDQLEKPMKFTDVPIDLSPYLAIFSPGGHGPLIEQHTIKPLGELLQSAHKQALPTAALCHGPTVFRSAALAGDFPYKGYKICVFPDSMDKKSPSFGYLPGQLTEEYQCEAKLKELGCLVQNTKMDDSTCVDRELITGASQLSAQNFSAEFLKVLAQKYDLM